MSVPRGTGVESRAMKPIYVLDLSKLTQAERDWLWWEGFDVPWKYRSARTLPPYVHPKLSRP